jgi:hypothetical protein
MYSRKSVQSTYKDELQEFLVYFLPIATITNQHEIIDLKQKKYIQNSGGEKSETSLKELKSRCWQDRSF